MNCKDNLKKDGAANKVGLCQYAIGLETFRQYLKLPNCDEKNIKS
jgi:hypothetical protein